MSWKKEKFIKDISVTNANLEEYFKLIKKDEKFRKFVLEQLFNNDVINIYYHSYLLIEKSSSENPDYYYQYWKEFTNLLTHLNSYHRNYAVNIIGNIICVDKNNYFDAVFEKFYNLLNDEKITTRKYCIANSVKIINSDNSYTEKIISKIIDSLRLNSNTEKQQNFLISEFLTLLNKIDFKLIKSEEVIEFLEEIKKSKCSSKNFKIIKNILSKSYNTYN